MDPMVEGRGLFGFPRRTISAADNLALGIHYP